MNAINTIIADGPASNANFPISKDAQDWELLVSPGHIVAERVKYIGWFGLPVAVLAAYFGVTSLVGAFLFPGYSVRIPDWAQNAFSGDPATWTDLGGGVRASYELAWLTQLPQSSGISSQGWTSLVQAVSKDVSAHGLDASAWFETAALDVGPQITRPSKALSEHIARLETGIVSVPEDGSAILIVSRIEGALGLAAITSYGGSCAVISGPAVAGCETVPTETLQTSLKSLKPTAQE